MFGPRPINRGSRCRKWKRVRGPGGERVLRCASFRYPPRPGRIGYARGHRPANKGRQCVKFKRVYSPWYNGQVYRCASYGPGSKRMKLLPPPREKVGRVRATNVRVIPPPMVGYIPLSLPSMERQQAGRTPLRLRG